ncbi:hypothetical protein [Desertivirga xinjiangensis]|uniref:hypothetical protein n=1 Tax=Desertivirga xinjiangensis TaxID=539206 RepID=UPI00210C4EF7|nr:hypothetical protein [Pedobacter xinjiangensis]
MKILLIEDDEKKTEDIREFVTKSRCVSKFEVKESYQSGIKELLRERYDLLLLDMSIPTFDKSLEESGGYYEKFGGYKVLKEVSRKKKAIKTVLITMFDDFGESDESVTLNQIDASLKQEFPDFFLGSVFYHATENKWQEELNKIITINSND